jgi:hypothetical protein
VKFYLGTHHPDWANIVNMSWFVSVERLKSRKSPLTGQDWILDSGGFTQIAKHGSYQITAKRYAKIINLQRPRLAFCQDWMCETHILEKTGLDIREHQRRTLQSYLELREMTDLVAPVLQGWMPNDYAQHIRDYQGAGVDMSQLFGVGTICSRNGKTSTIRTILKCIHKAHPGIRLHGFGLKTSAFYDARVVELLESADSMAWAYTAWKTGKLCYWCVLKSCSNCMEYAMLWRKKILQNTNRTQKQLELFDDCTDLLGGNYDGESHHREVWSSGDHPGCVHVDRSGFGAPGQAA